MGYRDEKETLRARVGSLEEDLAEAEDTIARLRGEARAPESTPTDDHSALLGSSKVLRLERDLPFEIRPEGYEAIAAFLKERMALESTQVGRRLTAGDLSIVYERGHSRLRWSVDWSSQRGGILSAASLFGLFGGAVSAGLGHDLAHLSPGQLAVLAGVSIAGVAASVGFAMRRRLRRDRQQQREQTVGAFERVVELAEQYRVEAATEGARVADTEVHDEVEEQVELEAPPLAAPSRLE